MKELDMVLLFYLEQHYLQALETERDAFVKVLDMQDPELYFLLLGKTVSEDESITNVISILQHAPRD